MKYRFPPIPALSDMPQRLQALLAVCVASFPLVIAGGLLLLPQTARAQCTNCAITTVGSDTVLTFAAGNGTFTPPAGVTQVEYLVVAGGGGGGGLPANGNFGGAGGGGAGGYRVAVGFPVTPLQVYNVVVGIGGAGGVGNVSLGGNGGDSSFDAIVATGGGGGATGGVSNTGQNGGSGGGGRIGGNPGGTGVAGQGNDGGAGNNAGGGGGGAGGAGGDGGANTGGAGGAGVSNSITGAALTYATGGDGGNYGSGRAAGVAGTAGAGNGGSGASGDNGGAAFDGGAGGSGVVIIRYSLTPPATIPLGTCDDFESGLGNWNVLSSGGDAGTGGATFNSASNSMFTRWGVVSVTSNSVDYSSSTQGTITAWIQRGDNGFSNYPEAGEDLILEYLNSSNTWVALETFPGGGTTAETFSRTYSLPSDALHASFQLRFRQTGGSGNDFDYWHIDDVCFLGGLPTPVAYYALDKSSWTGAAGEVVDDSGNGLDGQSFNGAFTDDTTPAVAGSPGTCRYGVFDGTNQYVNVPDNALLDMTGEFTVAAWINPDTLTAALMTIVSKDENFEFHLTNAGQINWWWQNSGGTARQITTTGTAIAAGGGWYHVAIVYSQSAATQTVYIDGVPRGTTNFNETLTNNADSLQIGSDQGFAGRYFDGQIDEVYVFDQALTSGEITALRNSTHACRGDLSAYYAMDETAWNGTPGEILDGSGFGNHANRVGAPVTASANPALAGDPGTCGYGSMPANTSTTTFDAVDTTNVPGAAGSITFWYNSNTNWSGGGSTDQMLLDASANLGGNGADKFFFLTKRANGRLRFVVEDSNDTTSTAETGNLGFGAGTWVHIGITWDLTNDRLEIYANGTLEDTSGTNLNGTPGNWNSLYIGDNRTDGVGGSQFTGNSANGPIDEVRIYDATIPQAVIQSDMAETHPCTSTDHIAISHDGAAVTCQAETITITVHQADHTVDTTYTGTLSLTTTPTRGDWTLISGNGTLNNGAANDGAATYTMAAGDLGQVVLALKDTTVETVNINVSDGTISENSGTATAAEDADLAFAESGFQFLAGGVASTIGTQIAGKTSNVSPGAQVLELQAIRTSDSTGACEAALSGNVNVELAFECEDPVNCTASQAAINGTNIAGNNSGSVTAYTAVPLDFGTTADTTATFTLNYPDSGQIQLHARYNMPLDDGSSTPSGNYMTGASNSFVVRPFGFYITAAGNPAASSAAGAAYTRAGAAFTANVAAVLWQAADDADADGVPDGYGDTDPANNANLADNAAALNFGQETTAEGVTLSSVLVLPSPGNDPGLSGTTSLTTFTNGAGSTSVNFSEVGIIEIAARLSDNDFLGAGNVLGRSTYVGRFIPNHYAVIFSDIVSACTSAPPGFTYSRQPFTGSMTIEAQNSTGNLTSNYRDGFDTLNPATELTFVNDQTGAVYDSEAVSFLAGQDFSDVPTGTASLDLQFRWDMPLQAPVDTTVQLTGATDEVGNVTGAPVDIGSSNIRYGRLFLENTFGSELLPLTLPLYAEYYDGAQFVRNTGDSCTNYSSGSLTFSNPVPLGFSVTPNGATGTLNQGGYGTIDPVIQITANGQQPGSICIAHTVPDYLRFNWAAIPGLSCTDPDGDPSAKATFGIFDGSQRQIYIREVY